jgi:hypothetical protein
MQFRQSSSEYILKKLYALYYHLISSHPSFSLTHSLEYKFALQILLSILQQIGQVQVAENNYFLPFNVSLS